MKKATRQNIGYSMIAVIVLPIIGIGLYLVGKSLAGFLGWSVIFGVLAFLGTGIYIGTTLWLIREG